MTSNKSDKNKETKQNPKSASQNTNTEAGFFQFTKHQLSLDIKKYDNAIARNTSSLNSRPFNTSQNRPSFMPKRLNSFDSTMLEEVAYNVLDDTELKLEKRIENLENNIRDVNEKIVVAETLKDIVTLDELNLQKQILKKNLENVRNEYQSKNIDTRMTSIIADFLLFPQKIKNFFHRQFRYFLFHSKFIKKFKPLMRSIMVRDTLGKLDKINKSVDELVKMQVPFGEQEVRYEKLVNHLSRAGALHSQIMKELNG